MVSNLCGLFSFVDFMSSFYRFMFHLSVAGKDLGKYLCTACAVRPSHVKNWLFAPALIGFFSLVRIRIGGGI